MHKEFSQQSMDVTERLKQAGLRPTRQRIVLGTLLWHSDCENRHVTAENLHQETQKNAMPVSLATVYNTLHQFTERGLLREVVVDGGKSYFDTNVTNHHHFLYEESGRLEDVPSEAIAMSALPQPSCGSPISRVDVVIRVKGA